MIMLWTFLSVFSIFFQGIWKLQEPSCPWYGPWFLLSSSPKKHFTRYLPIMDPSWFPFNFTLIKMMFKHSTPCSYFSSSQGLNPTPSRSLMAPSLYPAPSGSTPWSGVNVNSDSYLPIPSENPNTRNTFRRGGHDIILKRKSPNGTAIARNGRLHSQRSRPDKMLFRQARRFNQILQCPLSRSLTYLDGQNVFLRRGDRRPDLDFYFT